MSIIIIGSGLAGYQLAREFRRNDPNTPLLIITADEGRFYSKPLLSTALTNKKDFISLTTASAEQMAAQLNARILTNCPVTQIDAKEKKVICGAQSFGYDKLVLACGADVIKAPLEGDAVDDVMSVNHLYHYSLFQTLIKQKKHITILGAGLIGCEFANDLCNAGYHVDVIAPAATPLELLIPESIGLLLQKALSDHGVQWHLGCVVKTVNHADDGYHLTLSDNTELKTDLVLSAIGLIPHVGLARSAELMVNRGIIVNRYLETSKESIYALGDCAEVEGHVLPYITPLLNCARALAKTLAGSQTAVDYPPMPVIVKTPIHPLVICPPPRNVSGQWQISAETNNVRALYYDEDNQLRGFVLTNEAVKERQMLVKELPHLF